MKGIQPVKASALKPLGMAVILSGWEQPEVPCVCDEEFRPVL